MHTPVLCAEIIELLMAITTAPPRVFLDATFGRGGHSQALLEHLLTDDQLIVLDRDPSAVAVAQELASTDKRVVVLHGGFADFDMLMQQAGMADVLLDGAVFDLGVSSPQLEQAERGFSFLRDGPLDMRMDPNQGQSAAQWLNQAEAREITQVLRDFGEERHAKRIVQAVIAKRPITTTVELADLVEQAVPSGYGKAGRGHGASSKHSATRTFQAIRIYVNDELSQLDQGLSSVFERLKVGGRLAVISFQSLEDRRVKRFFRRLSSPPPLPRRLPVAEHQRGTVRARRIVGPVRASATEVADNTRARSAVLRVVERAA